MEKNIKKDIEELIQLYNAKNYLVAENKAKQLLTSNPNSLIILNALGNSLLYQKKNTRKY